MTLRSPFRILSAKVVALARDAAHLGEPQVRPENARESATLETVTISDYICMYLSHFCYHHLLPSAL